MHGVFDLHARGSLFIIGAKLLEPVHRHCPPTYDVTVFSYFLAESCRERFMEGLGLERGPAHMVDRKSIFEDVMMLYTDDYEKVLSEYPLCIRFKGEMGVDLGGVTRDMFSAFFSTAYIKMFDGTSTLFPASHAGVDISKFRTLGTVMSHAYLEEFYLIGLPFHAWQLHYWALKSISTLKFLKKHLLVASALMKPTY